MKLTKPYKVMSTVFMILSFACAEPKKTAVELLPVVKQDEPLTDKINLDKRHIVLAGGCFWGIEGVFKHVDGVVSATPGYSGGDQQTADYETVSSGVTQHAESVDVVYDPAKITLGKLLQIFFSVAHDPTQLNRQGPDVGKQYRSVIFFETKEQEAIAKNYVQQLNTAHAFTGTIVTEIAPLKAFYPAEAYHQNFMAKHPDHPYIKTYDQPKIDALAMQFPAWYVKK